jgi:hypothetical protein
MTIYTLMLNPHLVQIYAFENTPKRLTCKIINLSYIIILYNNRDKI